MGTNYYARINICEHCKRYNEIHIGKSSFGWKFGIEMHEGYYENFESFINFIKRKDVKIFDEYGKEISSKDLLIKIASKSNDKSHFVAYPKDKYEDCVEADLHSSGFS